MIRKKRRQKTCLERADNNICRQSKSKFGQNSKRETRPKSGKSWIANCKTATFTREFENRDSTLRNCSSSFWCLGFQSFHFFSSHCGFGTNYAPSDVSFRDIKLNSIPIQSARPTFESGAIFGKEVVYFRRRPEFSTSLQEIPEICFAHSSLLESSQRGLKIESERNKQKFRQIADSFQNFRGGKRALYLRPEKGRFFWQLRFFGRKIVKTKWGS